MSQIQKYVNFLVCEIIGTVTVKKKFEIKPQLCENLQGKD